MATLSGSLKALIADGREVKTVLEQLSSLGERAGEDAEQQAQIVFQMLDQFAGQVERISAAGGRLSSPGDAPLGPPGRVAAGGDLRSAGDRLLGPSETREIGQEIAKEINQSGGGGGGGGGGDINSFLRLRGGF